VTSRAAYRILSAGTNDSVCPTMQQAIFITRTSFQNNVNMKRAEIFC
jgi:formylmethanofuran:tetrahydromethanopterin formyltransferase